MQIGFDNKRYDLKDTINIDATRLQATVIKGNHTMDEIVTDATNAETIYIYDDNRLIGQYVGYDKPIAFSLYVVNNTDVVSVELNNTNYDETLSNLMTIVNTHEEAITDLAADMEIIDRHTDEIESIDAAVSDLGVDMYVVDKNLKELNETQESQDAAIEDLAETVVGLMEE